MKIIICGLSVTSSWGNGHATTYRALLKGLVARGHEVTFLERDLPWYAAHRDLRRLPGVEIELYNSPGSFKRRYRRAIMQADAVVVGSYVPDAIELGRWILRTADGVVGFYDIDTPVTLATLADRTCRYLEVDLIREYPLYLSFTGGPVLRQLELEFGSPCARALYCGVDPSRHHPVDTDARWELGYLGTYAADRQPALERLLVQPATTFPYARFAVAGSQYPAALRWPRNVTRIEHLAPEEHGRFYAEQRFTLNITRAAMIRAGFSPSVRLFEAAACGTPIITDAWPGLETVFQPGRELIVAHDARGVVDCLREFSPDKAREIGRAARARVLAHHTGVHRAAELEAHLREAATCAIEQPSRGIRGRRMRKRCARLIA